jgi:hypothetical protein
MDLAKFRRADATNVKSALLLAAFIASVLGLIALMGPISQAGAAYNCYLAPNGTCDSPQAEAGQYTTFANYTQDRAGCVRALGYYGEAVSSWNCAPAWSVAVLVKPNPEGGWMRSSLKNNNGTYWANYHGEYSQ